MLRIETPWASCGDGEGCRKSKAIVARATWTHDMHCKQRELITVMAMPYRALEMSSGTSIDPCLRRGIHLDPCTESRKTLKDHSWRVIATHAQVYLDTVEHIVRPLDP